MKMQTDVESGTAGAGNRSRTRALATAFVLYIVFSCALSAAEHPSSWGATTAGDLGAFRKYANSFEWVDTVDLGARHAHCQRILADIRSGKRIAEVLPRVVTDDPDDAAFAPIGRCGGLKPRSNIQSEADEELVALSVEAFGDRSFRLYLPAAQSARGSMGVAIIYGEFAESKVRLNTYSDGYTLVNFEQCTRGGMMPTQRRISSDGSSTARNFMHGVFEHRGDVIVLEADGQIAKTRDEKTFQSLTVWRLAPPDGFLLDCAWTPKYLLDEVSKRKAQ